MTEKQIRKMLSDIILDIDYDIWKSYFVCSDGCGDEECDDPYCCEPTPAKDQEKGTLVSSLLPLIDIVNKHLKKAAKPPRKK